LQLDAIAKTFKRVAQWVGMTPEEAKEVSGYSIRVGATQDMWTSMRLQVRIGVFTFV
jgi:hypothetical protein